jgi:His-Xaa-Ser system protein HxsD
MTDAFEVLVDGSARSIIDLRIYRIAAVKKTAYRLADRCTVVIGTPDSDLLPVTFLFGDGTAGLEIRNVVRAFFQELLDQELREAVAEETQAIRTLILASAFSKTDLIGR